MKFLFFMFFVMLSSFKVTSSHVDPISYSIDKISNCVVPGDIITVSWTVNNGKSIILDWIGVYNTKNCGTTIGTLIPNN
jgi:hypothetical protein